MMRIDYLRGPVWAGHDVEGQTDCGKRFRVKLGPERGESRDQRERMTNGSSPGKTKKAGGVLPSALPFRLSYFIIS